jgi:hypothetical protein
VRRSGEHAEATMPDHSVVAWTGGTAVRRDRHDLSRADDGGAWVAGQASMAARKVAAITAARSGPHGRGISTG